MELLITEAEEPLDLVLHMFGDAVTKTEGDDVVIDEWQLIIMTERSVDLSGSCLIQGDRCPC